MRQTHLKERRQILGVSFGLEVQGRHEDVSKFGEEGSIAVQSELARLGAKRTTCGQRVPRSWGGTGRPWDLWGNPPTKDA
eukprot:2831796-Amphidinium_carterae.2